MTNTDKWCFTWVPNQQKLAGSTKAALLNATQWSSGDIVIISFLDGDYSVQEKVKQYAQEWTAPRLANLTLSFRKDTNDTMIRISFRYSGSWSVLGRSCKQITDLSQPTMNYGWLRPETSDDEVRRVVLHEFGHALGLIHEHQNPKNKIEWDRNAVIKDLSGEPNKWDEQTIEFNMFKRFAEAEVRATPIDATSIMMYPIPARWTKNGFSAGLNTDLSADDKSLIHQAYP